MLHPSLPDSPLQASALEGNRRPKLTRNLYGPTTANEWTTLPEPTVPRAGKGGKNSAFFGCVPSTGWSWAEQGHQKKDEGKNTEKGRIRQSWRTKDVSATIFKSADNFGATVRSMSKGCGIAGKKISSA